MSTVTPEDKNTSITVRYCADSRSLRAWTSESLWVVETGPWNIQVYGGDESELPSGINLKQIRSWMCRATNQPWVPTLRQAGHVKIFSQFRDEGLEESAKALTEFLDDQDQETLGIVESFSGASGELQHHMLALLQSSDVARELSLKSPNLFYLVAVESIESPQDSIVAAEQLAMLSAEEICDKTNSVRPWLLRKIVPAAFSSDWREFCALVKGDTDIRRFLRHVRVVTVPMMLLFKRFHNFEPRVFKQLEEAGPGAEQDVLAGKYFKVEQIADALGLPQKVPKISSLGCLKRVIKTFSCDNFPDDPHELETLLETPLPNIGLNDTRWLKRAETIRDLRRIGLKLKNCLLGGELEKECLNGEKAVFFQSSSLLFPDAVVVLARDQWGAILLEIAEGSSNSELSDEQRDFLEGEIMRLNPFTPCDGEWTIKEEESERSESADQKKEKKATRRVSISMDRSIGKYSGALFSAWPCEPTEIPEAVFDRDQNCKHFWTWATSLKNPLTVGLGDSEEEALEALLRREDENDHHEEEPRRVRGLGDWLPPRTLATTIEEEAILPTPSIRQLSERGSRVMMFLKRKTGEQVVLSKGHEEAIVKVEKAEDGSCRLGFDLPRSWSCHREEIVGAIQARFQIREVLVEAASQGGGLARVTVSFDDGSRAHGLFASFEHLNAISEKTPAATEELEGQYFFNSRLVFTHCVTSEALETLTRRLYSEQPEKFRAIFQRDIG